MNPARKQSRKPEITVDALLAALHKADLPPPPKGARTLRELCDSFTPPRAERTVERLLEKAGAKKLICRGVNGRHTAYYVMP